MKISVKLFKNKLLKNGNHPVIIECFDGKKQRRFSLKLYSSVANWDFEKNIPLISHPDYDYLFPKMFEINKKVKELNYETDIDFDYIKKFFLKNKVQKISLSDFVKKMMDSMKLEGRDSTAEVYRVDYMQFEKYINNADWRDFNYETLNNYKVYKLKNNLSPTTVHKYLRTLRAIYNEAVRSGIIENKRPFDGVFAGLRIRSYAQKKKYLDKKSIKKMEDVKLTGTIDYVRDLFLLQFYFAGADLIDIYNLKKSDYSNGRIYFIRKKLKNGYMIDLRVFEKAELIIQKYITDDEYIFPGSKLFSDYKTFRRKYQKYLIKLQKMLNIDVLPVGGNIGIKVARHTFANIGKRLFIEEDILRELMGHQRDDIDNYYKDKYPEEVRDAAHWKIIDTTNLQ